MPAATKKTSLSLSKMNMIMNSCLEVHTINKSSSLVMCKATELFIAHLAKEGFKRVGKGRKLDYKHLAEVVHDRDKYMFLREMMPKKITVSEYKKIITRKSERGDKDSGASSQSSDEDDDTSGTDESEASNTSA